MLISSGARGGARRRQSTVSNTTVNLSKTQIDRLGDRLRQGSLVAVDLRLLDGYRRSFGEAYEAVVRAIRGELHLEPTGRPAKSTGSIVEKLLRESIRLSQVQDIAGCRLVVADMVEQERVVASLRSLFPAVSVVDRRATPSFGYRAVHVVVHLLGTLVEIQVRSSVQHLWAELSEKVADVVDPATKYGGGPDSVRAFLRHTSEQIAAFERVEFQISELETKIAEVETKITGTDTEIVRLERLGQTQPPERHEQQRVIKQQLVGTKQRLLTQKERHVIAKGQLMDALNDGLTILENLKQQQQP